MAYKKLLFLPEQYSFECYEKISLDCMGSLYGLQQWQKNRPDKNSPGNA